MAFFCGHMLQMALEIAQHDEDFADMALRFLKQYLLIAAEISKPLQDGGGLDRMSKHRSAKHTFVIQSPEYDTL